MKDIRALIIFSIIVLIPFSAAQFTYYPDDKPGGNDMIMGVFTTETYYKAYFVAAANDPTYVIDEKNGIVIEGKATMCTGGSPGPFGTLDDTVVQRQQLLSVGIQSTTPATGLICDLNVDDILSKSQHPIMIRLWVLKVGTTDAPTVTYKGNAPAAASCSNTAADLVTAIPGGTTFTAADNILVEEIKILKDTSTVTNAKLTINGGTQTSIYYCNTATPPHLYVAIALGTPTLSIYLSYLQVNILSVVTSGTETTYRLKSSSACTKNSECFPGVSCTDAALCSGKYHPACAEPDPSIKMGATYSIETETCGTYCSTLAKSLTKTNGVCSPLTHVDVTQFASFQSAAVNKKISNAYTMGLWLFTPKVANLSTASVNFSMSSLMMISLGNSAGKAVVYCSPYLGLYPSLEEITTTAAMETKYTESALGIGKSTLGTTTDGRWFHVRCAFNLDSKKLYLMITNAQFNSGTVTLPTEITLPRVKYYSTPAALFEFPFKNMSPTTQFKVKGANALTTAPIFLRQVAVFTDYLPLSFNFPIQYFDFTNLASNSKFKSLWLFGVELKLTSATAANVKMYYYDKTNTQQSLEESVNMNASYNLVPPTILYRLNLPGVNQLLSKSYKSPPTDITTCGTDKICWENSMGLSCPAGTFYDVTEATAGSECKASCPASTMPQLGKYSQSSNTSDYCTYPCKTGSGSSAVTNALCASSNYFSQFQCETSYTKVNWDCLLTTNIEKGALFYSRGVGSGVNIKIPITLSNANKYYLEFWLNIDRAFTPPVQAAGILNFVWYTSGLKIAKPANDLNVTNFKLYINPTGSAISTTALSFTYGQWQRIFYQANLSDTNQASVKFHESPDFTVPNTDSLSLTSIMFCNGAQCPCADVLCTTTETTTNLIYWFSAFYRNIKIWNWEESTDLYKEYSELFSKNIPRFPSQKYFIPLNFQNLKDGKITDPKNPTTNLATFQYYTEEIQSSPLSFYQYSAVVDSVFSDSGQVTLNGVTDYIYAVKETTCTDTNCKYCNSFECFLCKDTYILKDGACATNDDVQYYLKSPSYVTGAATATDFAFKSLFTGTSTQFSVSFFFKMLGYVDNGTNSLTEYDIIRFGANLKLKYIISTKTLQLINGQTLLGTVLNFSRKLIWTNISLAYYSGGSKASYYPSMMNFQVNFINVQVTVPDVLTFDPITIPKESIGLYGKFYVWDKYITGPWAAMVNYKATVYPFVPTKTFLYQQKTATCVPNADNLDGAARANSCVEDFGNDTSDILNESNWCGLLSTSRIAFATNGVCAAAVATCPYGYYSDANSPCACMTDNTVFDTLILQNSSASKLYCQKLDYIDFGQFGEFSVSGIASAVTEYTIEFWVYIQTYVSGQFTGFDIKWDKQLKISIGSPSATQSSCYPLYDSTKDYPDKETITLPSSATPSWVYLRCSVDKANNKFFHYHQDLATTEKTLTGTGLTVSSSTTTLVFKNNSVNKGIIFFRQIRLWSCYLCQTPYTYKIKIADITLGNYLNILHIWDPVDITSTTVADIANSAGKVDMVVPSTPDASWIGYNILDESKYSPKTAIEAILCLQSANCESLLNQRKLNNVEISVGPSLFGRYTIELWTAISKAEDLSQGFHVRWKNLVSLSFIQNPSDRTKLNVYCWPQDYKMDFTNISGGTQITTLASSTSNSATYTTASPITSLTWFSTRCGVSYNTYQFYLNTLSPQGLKVDHLWGVQETSVPFRYFFRNGETTLFQILGAKSNVADIYIRYAYLFNDYLPQKVDFGNIDLTRITSTNIPSLVSYVSFYYNWRNLGGVLSNTGAIRSFYSPSSTTPTPSDTITLGLFCYPGQITSNAACTAVVAANIAPHSTFSSASLYPFQCASTYFWDETMYLDDHKTTPPTCTASTCTACTGSCTANSTRSPNSSTFCNYPCSNNVNYCPSAAADLADMKTKFTCKTDYMKYGYQCIDTITATNALLYFNGCLNFPNASYTVSSDAASKTKMVNGYLITFWIRLDRYNENCLHTNKRKFYFVFEPHSIYLDESTTNTGSYNVVYKNTLDSNISGTLTSFSEWNWNYISIHVNIETKFINVYSNYQFFKPNVSKSTTTDLALTKLLFCSVGGASCTTTASLADISWGAAFYKNLKVFDGTPWLGLESELKTYKDQLYSLCAEFPFNVLNSSASTITNIKPGNPIVFTPPIDTYDDLLVNYSTNFDLNGIDPAKYVTKTDGKITTVACMAQNCKLCTSNESTACLECNEGYKLYAGMCKKYSGYFLKTPVESYSNNLIRFNTTTTDFDLKSEAMVTWTIWIKFFGTIEGSTLSCITIIRLKSDESRYICYSNSDRKLRYYEKNNPLFEDTTFKTSIGEWVLLSFATANNTNQNAVGFGKYYKPYAKFYVNNQEVPRNVLYQISLPGISFDTFDIGNKISALFKDLRFYRSFLVNPYGYFMSSSSPLNTMTPIYSIPLFSTNSTALCLEASYILKGEPTDYSKTGLCVGDFHPLLTPCANTNYWVDKSQMNAASTPCTSCPSVCATGCAFSNTTSPELGCTCSTTDSWIVKDNTTETISCRKIPEFDISKGTTVVEKLNVASEGEYTTEFWFYIFSYNQTNIEFESFEVIWDLHNYFNIYNPGKNSLAIHCSPIYDDNNISPNSDEVNKFGYNKTFSDSSYFKWQYVQCATNRPKKLFQMEKDQNIAITISSDFFPVVTNSSASRLILRPKNANVNFGFFFIKELKLWSQWDISQFTSNCKNGNEMTSIFPTKLLHYFTYLESTQNVLTDQKSGANSMVALSRNFTGYNVLFENVASNSFAFPPSPWPNCTALIVFPEEIYNNQSLIIGVKENKERPIIEIFKCNYRIKGTNSFNDITVTSGKKEVTYSFALSQDSFGTQKELVIELYCDIHFDTTVATTSKAYKEILVKYKPEITDDFSTILSKLPDLNTLTDAQVETRIELLTSMITGSTDSNTVISQVVTVDNQIPTCMNNPNFCKNKGQCYELGNGLACMCLETYTGDNCQISKKNLDLLTAQTQALLNFQIANPYMNTTLSELTTRSRIINDILQINKQTFQSLSDFQPYVTILEKMSNQINQITKQATNTRLLGTTVTNDYQLFSSLYETIGMLVGYATKQIYKYKQKNFENYLKNNATSNQSENSDLKLVKYSLKYFNIYARLLQTLNINDPNIVTLIQIENESFPLIDLTSDQKNDFVNYYQKIQEAIVALAIGMIKMASNSDLDFLYTGSEISINVKKMVDPKNFDFLDYFTNPNRLNKTQKYESFFDAKACLAEYTQNMTTTEPLFFTFIGYNIFNRQYDNILTNSSISRMHQIELRNSNGEKVNITCGKGKEIKHYLPLLPLQNFDFFRYYSTYPSKFNQTSEENKTTVYPYYYIFPNGTIDHSTFDIQFEKYYNKYNIQLNQYLNDTGKYITTTPSVEDSVVYVNEGRYLIASSNTFGEFEGFSSLKEDIVYEKNFWYLHRPHILGCSENYRNNLCFYIFIIIFGLYWAALALLIVLSKCACKKKIAQSSTGDDAMDEFRENLRNEILLMEKDNERGGQDRYQFLFPDPIHDNISASTKRMLIEDSKKDKDLIIPDIHDKEKQTDFLKLKGSSPKHSTENVLKEMKQPKESKEDPNLWLNKKNPSTQNNFDKPEKIEVKTNSEQNNQDGGKYYDLKESARDLNVIVAPTSRSRDQDPDVMSKDDIRPLSEKKNYYNPLHFIVSRNIYANIFLLNWPFVPRYLFISKFMCLWYLLFDLVTILMVFVDYNLQNSISFDSGKFAGYIVFAVFAANIAYILISWCITTRKSTRAAIMNAATTNDKNELQKLMSRNNLKNLLSIILVNLFTFGLCALLYILSVGFCAVWSQWAHVLVLLWLFTLIADLIIMEILLELFILLFYLGKKIRVFNCIYLTLLAIKQLRNFD